MVRSVVILLLLSCALVSCRGDKDTPHLAQSSNGAAPTAAPASSQPSQNNSSSNNSSANSNEGEAPKPMTDVAQTSTVSITTEGALTSAPAGDHPEVTLDSQSLLKQAIVNATKTLSSMLDVSSTTPQNPLRMEGVVITNSTPQNSVLDSMSDAFLYKILGALTNDDEIRRNEAELTAINATRIQIEITKRLNLHYGNKVRLVTRDQMEEGLRSETNQAYSALLLHPEKYESQMFPLSIRISTNFYQKEAAYKTKSFYLQFVVDQAKLNSTKKDFLSFRLIDQNLDKPMKASLNIVDESQLKDPQAYKLYGMILQFQSIEAGYQVEQVAVLHMMPVKLQVKK